MKARAIQQSSLKNRHLLSQSRLLRLISAEEKPVEKQLQEELPKNNHPTMLMKKSKSTVEVMIWANATSA